jgi:DNA-binding MarR family transcriptional regulator
VRRLGAPGLVERRRDPIDTRRVTPGLTRQGRALDVPRPGTVEAAADALLMAMSVRDLAARVRVLDRSRPSCSLTTLHHDLTATTPLHRNPTA